LEEPVDADLVEEVEVEDLVEVLTTSTGASVAEGSTTGVFTAGAAMVSMMAAVSAEAVGRGATTASVLGAAVSAAGAEELVVSTWTTATGVVDSTAMAVEDEANVGSAEG
jgi:hypothetical protein